MATQPTFTLSDGSQAPTLNLVTSIRDLVLSGPLDANVVDVQVKVNDNPFVSDPSLVEFDLDGFVVPNPTVYPEGLRLDFGVNTIQVRIIDVLGNVSAPATATVEVVRESDLELRVQAPSGLRVRRRRDSVEIVWANSPVETVIGYNIYAATEAGGGDTGYIKLNPKLIDVVAFQEQIVRDISEDTTFYTNEGGVLHVIVVEEDFNGNPIKVVADHIIDPGPQSADEFSLTTNLGAVDTTEYMHFIHNRSAVAGVINNEFFVSVPNDEPLYYVITAVAIEGGRQIESAYSSELVGLPLVINTEVQEIQGRTQNDITRDYLASILRANNQISAIPGSVTRDIFVEPFATETERLHFITGFVRRSQSFATLLPIDDLDGDKISDPVQENPYKLALKSALGFTNDADVQSLIDDAFDKLASNVQKVRGGQEFAIGQVIFSTTTEPTTDIVIPEGTTVSVDNGPSFTTTSRVVLPFSSRSSFFNLRLRRWEIQANIRAVNPGSQGNVTAGTIRRVLGVSGVQVSNPEATRFGQDVESNADLAERCILAFSGVDSGTEGGYRAAALRQKGVFRTSIIKAGDAYMMRDWDEVRKKHIGGKVDVWVQGNNEIQVTDTFALSFQVASGVQFFLDSNPSDLIFITNDPRITPSTPITELLGATAAQIAQGFAFRNLTTNTTFDLTGYTLLSYNRIQLNTAIAQPGVSANDIVVGDLRYQADTRYIFTQQPVFGVASLSSVNTGTVLEEGSNYALYKIEDPLLEGNSAKAQDYITITQANGVPSGDSFIINDERHIMIGEEPEALDNLGVNPTTVRVFTLDRLTEYNGPNDPNPDFLIQAGNAITPLQIIRVPAGNITNGEEVSIDYEHDENFTVTYVVNDLIRSVQAQIDISKHITADALVKATIPNPATLEMTVVLKPNVNQSTVDRELKTSLSQLLNNKPVGAALYQSDVVRAVENTKGVSYVILPMARMTLSDGTLIVREPLNNDSTFLSQQGSTKVYILKDTLMYPTTDGGGVPTGHRGVFQDTQPLTLVGTYSSLQGASGRAMIIGSSGLSIMGYSDDVTLTGQGFDTTEEREARRRALTANRVLVSLDELDGTEMHTYDASYSVQGDKGSKDLIVGDVAHIELGDLTISYPESD